jgi:hypothetical protein
MNLYTANEVMACLSSNRTLFHYYKDRYSIGLLKQYALQKNGIAISALKQSSLAALTQKPRVKRILSNLGNKHLHADFLNQYDYDDAQTAYTLNLVQ